MPFQGMPLAALRRPEYERALASLLLMLGPILPHLCSEMWLAFASEATLKEYKVTWSVIIACNTRQQKFKQKCFV